MQNLTEPSEICQRRLDRIHNGEHLTTDELEEEFDGLLPYKGRPLKGRLIHFAIWKAATMGQEEGEALVQKVLDAGADKESKASYITRKKREGHGYKINELKAVHIAVAFGCIPALNVISKPPTDVSMLVSTWSLLDGTEKFYLPIHEATFTGQKHSVIWLLKHGAAAAEPNLDGYTPLHWLALQGLEPKADLEIVVKSLVEHAAELDKRSISGPKGEIPLQLAAADNSKFPRDLMYLLMPSAQDEDEQNADDDDKNTFISDMCLLASFNTRTANQFARHRAAQKKNAVDRMAHLFHKAPAAAADIMDILTTAPVVQDEGYHPIYRRAKLDQDDVVKADGIRIPQWGYDAGARKAPSWHQLLIPVLDNREDGNEDVDDVQTKAVLLPNILDIDLIKALARMPQAHINTFDRLSVQGVLYCLWDHFVCRAIYALIFSDFVDLYLLVVWGYLRTESIPEEEVSWLQAFGLAMMWCILAANLVRDVFSALWRFWAHYKKYCEHRVKFNQWVSSNTTDGSPSPTARSGMLGPTANSRFAHGRTLRERGRPPSLHALWRPLAFLTWPLLMTELVPACVKTAFIYSVFPQEGAMSEVQHGFLTASTLLQCLKLLYTLSLTNFGKKVPTILRAFFSRAISGMMFNVFLALSSVALACSMSNPAQTLTWHMLRLYKGVFLGDSGAFEELRLNPVLLVITMFISVCIHNLMIAIYGNEYDRLEQNSERYFLRERARCCCEYLLAVKKLQPCRTMLPIGLLVGFIVAFLLGLLLTPRGCSAFGTLRWRMAMAVSFAALQMLLHSAWLESPWFPLREDRREEPESDHFLWISRSVGACGGQPDDRDSLEALTERLSRMEAKLEKSVAEVQGQYGHGLEALTERLSRMENNIESSIERMQRQYMDDLTRRLHRMEAKTGSVGQVWDDVTEQRAVDNGLSGVLGRARSCVDRPCAESRA
eukprot:CAMPEP_0115537688 /NCGR_PEP_ID=MMETSP0271-20121206/88464_1 /TAXON_ID=71861 /ORGANISM="Scrippsiella trochoidea, Strain CCMP3099" /LENGTH=945 /DNA_ID=CAMNT_0002970505 /DNA_START=84 /DNA_END=2921 /DNA_ORIENTATION=+